MSNKKALRAQRHLSQPKTVERNISETSLNRTEGYERTTSGLKKTVVYNDKKYVIDMVKE